MYKVIKFFTDLQDHSRPYHVGDEFPRKGMAVSEKRLAELSSSANKQGVPLIEKVKAPDGLGSVIPPVELQPVRQEAPSTEEEEKKVARKATKAPAKPKRATTKRKKDTE